MSASLVLFDPSTLSERTLIHLDEPVLVFEAVAAVVEAAFVEAAVAAQ